MTFKRSQKGATKANKAQSPVDPKPPQESQNGIPAPLETEGHSRPSPENAPPEAQNSNRLENPEKCERSHNPPATVSAPVATEDKERRGKRYTSFQSVRKGLARVANDLELGKADPKAAAVRVQALQAIANVLAQQEQARIEGEVARIQRQADEVAQTHAAKEKTWVGHG